MGSEWVQLRDIVSIKGGKRLPKGESLQVDPNSHPYIRVRDMGSKYIPREGLEFVPDTVFPKIKNYIVNENDVIISIVGTVGLVAVIDSFFDSASQTENCAKLSGLDALDAQYLYYCLVSPLGQREIAVQTVGAVQPKLPLYGIENITIPWPLRSIRESIVGCLGGLDNKIALNRQINTTLESMAQALFKSWFVDFDPVIDNALAAGNEIPDELAARAARREALRQQTSKTTNKTTGATDAVSVEQALPETGLSDQRLPCEIQQLFPDRFVFTEEMGWVPEGWEPAQIKDIAEYGNSRVDAVEIDRDNYVSTENMLVDKAGVVAASSVPEAAQVPSYEKGSILISNIRPYFKKIWLASHSGGRSNDVLEFKVKAAGTEGYLYSLLCQDLFFEYMMATSKGTKMPRGDKQAIMNWSVAVPSVDLQELFSEQVSLFQDSIVSRNEQSVCLANLRDSLLPKLLSGQITIPDAEQQLAEVL